MGKQRKLNTHIYNFPLKKSKNKDDRKYFLFINTQRIQNMKYQQSGHFYEVLEAAKEIGKYHELSRLEKTKAWFTKLWG